MIRAGDPKPMPGSPRHTSHRNNIHILVVAAYLLYTIYEANYDLRSSPSFYTELGIPVTAGEREIKSRFRRLAALHHPDKAGSNSEDVSAFFIHLKQASETLQDVAKRFAYERFGPDMVAWQKCVTIRDYVTKGVVATILPHYGVAASTVYILGIFGYMDFAKYYRWLILITLCLFEVTTVTRPGYPPMLSVANYVLGHLSSAPPYLPFEIIHLARKLTITIYIAMSQIGPLLVQQVMPQAQNQPIEDDPKVIQQGLLRLEGAATQLDNDLSRTLEMELTPFKGNPEIVANLQGKMREWLVQNTIRADPMVRDALGTSFRKRRVDAPAGAKGNR